MGGLIDRISIESMGNLSDSALSLAKESVKFLLFNAIKLAITFSIVECVGCFASYIFDKMYDMVSPQDLEPVAESCKDKDSTMGDS